MPTHFATPTECMQQLIMLPPMVKRILFAQSHLARNSVTPSPGAEPIPDPAEAAGSAAVPGGEPRPGQRGTEQMCDELGWHRLVGLIGPFSDFLLSILVMCPLR